MMRMANRAVSEMPSHRPGEIENARHQRQQHVEQGAIGARIGNDVEESATALRAVASGFGKGS